MSLPWYEDRDGTRWVMMRRCWACKAAGATESETQLCKACLLDPRLNRWRRVSRNCLQLKASPWHMATWAAARRLRDDPLKPTNQIKTEKG